MDIDVAYNLTDLRDLARRFPGAVRSESETTLDRIVRRLEAEAGQRTPKGVGGGAGLAGSIAGEVMMMGKSVVGIVGTPLEYGEVVEMGRRPNRAMPPIAPIQRWVRSKLGISGEKEQRSVAYAIALTIAREGFEGAHMFEQAWKALESWVQGELYGIGGRVVKRMEA